MVRSRIQHDFSREKLWQAIVETLRSWPARERRVFVRSHYKGESAAAIASATGMTVKDVERMLAASDRKLRQALRDFRGNSPRGTGYTVPLEGQCSLSPF